MLQKLLFLACILGASNAIAQQKLSGTQIDYRLPGAPMPPLRYIVYQDSTLKKNTGKNETVVSGKRHGRKKKKQNEDEITERANSETTGHALTNKDFDNGANLFVMMFNPTCSHCQDETIMLEKNSSLFKKTKIALLASAGMQPYINDFITFTHVDHYASFMYLGIDSSDFIKNVYLYQALPQINIYDKSRKLIRAYSGETAIDSLKKYIE